MAELFALSSLIALLTLTALEVVLGIDNLVVISIITAKLPPVQQPRARRIGLILAALGRIVLLFAITWVISLEQTALFELPFGIGAGGHGEDGEASGPAMFSVKDLILVVGGIFLLGKATWEIHHSLEGHIKEHHETGETTRTSGWKKFTSGFSGAIIQILAMDLVFSIDSVLTAIGMVRPENYSAFWIPLTIMITGVVLAIIVMVVFANPVGNFVVKHPTVKMLALAFMLLIGIVLIAEGLHQHIPRGYIYFGMAFSLFVEMLNLRASSKRKKQQAA